MCFNKETSMLSFIVGLAVTLKLFGINEPFLGVFMLFVCLMQLLEFFLWVYLKTPKLNLRFSIGVYLLIYLQPIVFFVAAVLFENSDVDLWIWILFAVYCIVPLYWLYKILTTYRPSFLTTTNKSDCRLSWNIFNGNPVALRIIMFILYVFFFIYATYQAGYWELGLIGAGTLILVMLNYQFYLKVPVYKGITPFGSLFCFYCNIISVFFILFYI